MKKITIFCCVLLYTSSTFAYYDNYNYSSQNDEMSSFAIFTLIVMIAYIVLSIIVLNRWWKMTSNVGKITQHLTQANPKLTYLVAIGEKDQAQKAALKMLVDILYPIYSDSYNNTKAECMNDAITNLLPKIYKLGLSVPEYVTSGEKFIDYINQISDNNIPYKN